MITRTVTATASATGATPKNAAPNAPICAATLGVLSGTGTATATLYAVDDLGQTFALCTVSNAGPLAMQGSIMYYLPSGSSVYWDVTVSGTVSVVLAYSYVAER